MRLVMLILRRDGGLLSWFGGVGWNCVYNVLPVGRAVGSLLALLVLVLVADDEWRDRGSGIGYTMVYLEGTRIFCKQDGSNASSSILYCFSIGTRYDTLYQVACIC